ncbi:DUF6134 family protein [Winogradskyella wichelsiae]|uniref:DUF6134 family protein n=1 Tax=Winogradskyella wichelsiae TaxID=2697007 RepID=UPI0015CB7561|nr:DUF6134 family protein [Winogradskyella wichelsiae]
MIRFFIVSLLCLILGNTSSSIEENLNFDIIHKGKIVGSLKATKTTKHSKTYYQSSTTITTRILKDIRVNYKYDVIFSDDLLESSTVNISINEKSHAETHTQKNGTDYDVIKNNTNKDTLKEAIHYATVQLYFEEPKNISQCYSEQDASFNTIKPLGNHTYKKVNLKGKENIYYYKKGALKKATIDGGLIKFEIIATHE